MKKNLFYLLLSLIFCSCDSDPIVVDLGGSFTGITIGNGVVVDSILKYDTAYYKIGTLVCDSDTVFQFKYTSLLSIDHQFEAYFIPSSSFENYIDLFTSSFSISPILEWNNPQEYMSVVASIEPNKVYSPSYHIQFKGAYFGKDYKNWEYITNTDAPEKIYYNYDWESNLHYDGMPYNADLVVLTFSIDNAESDSIARIDSVILSSGQKTIKANVTSQLLLRDTIDILTDTTYIYRLEGRMKGQSCGADLFEVRSHKGEIISAQDAHYRHQSSIYEYDE